MRVELVLHPAIGQLADKDHRLNPALRSLVSTDLGQVLQRLGIPGSPSVTVRRGHHESNDWGWVSVDNHRYRQPVEFPRRVQTYVRGDHGGPEADLGIVPWLAGLLADPASAGVALAFCRTATTEIVKRRPSVLLGPGQARAYARRLGAELDPEWLRQILQRLLDLKVSIADMRAVGRELVAARDMPPVEAVERLFPKLRPDHVEVRLPEAYLRQLTLDAPGEASNLFGRLREQCFDELGIVSSPLQAVVDEALPARTFAVVVNHLPQLPWLGLDAGETMVARPPAEAALTGLEVLGPVMNPRTGVQNTRIRQSRDQAHLGPEWPSWDPLGFLTLAVKTDLEDSAACLIDADTTSSQVGWFAASFPTLGEAAGARLPNWRLTAVLRRLVDQGIGVRDSWLVLERLLDADSLDLDDDERLAAWVRMALVPATLDRYTWGGTIGVYVIDPAMEQLLEHAGPVLAEADRERVLTAIGEVLRVHAGNDAPAMVLTADGVAPTLRHAIAEELPRMAVFSYGDLPPGLRVHLEGRIRLSA